MALTSKILSGAHLEVQFSESYIKLLIDKAFAGKLIPAEFSKDDFSFKVLGLSYLKFIEKAGANVELAVTSEVAYQSLTFEVEIGAKIFVELSGTEFSYKYKSMTDNMRDLLKGLGLSNSQINLINQFLSDNLKGTYDFSGIVKKAASFRSKIIISSHYSVESCFSLMINLNGIEKKTIKPDVAKSFLKQGQEFCLGINAENIPPLVAPIKAKVQEWVQDNFSEDYVKTVSITPKNSGKLKVKIFIKGIEGGVDWIDPDIDLQTEVALNIINGKINLKADRPDIEIGNWFTDVVVGVIGSIAGGVVGFLVGAIFGGPALGAIIGGSLVGLSGLVGIHEYIAEELVEDAAGQFLSAVYAIPYNMKIAEGVWLDHHFTGREIDSKGIVLEGIQKRKLYAVKRDESGFLESVVLDDKTNDMDNALENVKNNALKIADLVIIAVNKSSSRIVKLKFENDVVMSVDETIEWQLKGLWNVAGVILIQPKEGNMYYRTAAGDARNLDDYPTFHEE